MRKALTYTAALTAILFVGACDRQSFDETKGLHAKYKEGHGAAGHDSHGAKTDPHGEKPAEHAAKKDH